MTTPAAAFEQEVRFAVVMYGGVSLAIYINGVAQELFGLVQATAPARDGSGAHHPSAGAAGDAAAGGPVPLRPSAQVYRELGQRLGLTALAPETAADAPIRTRFVVDVLSGTSAGGINGVLLAKALASESDFGLSRRLWTDVADLYALLGGRRSWAGIAARPRPQVRSLLNGHRFYDQARRILATLNRRDDAGGRSAYCEQLDLAVTATDLTGLPTPLPLRFGAGAAVTEPQHRKVFELSSGTVATSGGDHSDFSAAHDRLLAFAARATSSFPFAFEPVALGALLPFEGDERAAVDPAAKETERRLFAEYEPGGVDGETVWFADGGYLDNKPFSYATRALRRRRADLPVARKLLYVEPDPAPRLAATDAHRRYDGVPPKLLDNLRAATIGLRGFEPIRQDLAEIAERNAQVGRLRSIEHDAAGEIVALDDAAAREWERQPGHAAYLDLRLRAVLDQLAEAALVVGRQGAAERAAGAVVRGEEEAAVAIRAALRDWSASAFGDGGPAGRAGGVAPGGGTRDAADGEGTRLRAWLDEHDGAFHHRRLSFLHDRLNELLRGAAQPRYADLAAEFGVELAPVAPAGPGGAASVASPAAVAPADPDGAPAAARSESAPPQRGAADDLRGVKRALNDALVPLREAEWALTRPRLDRLPAPLVAAARALRAAPSDQTAAAFATAVGDHLREPLRRAAEGVSKALGGAQANEAARMLLERYHRRFPLFDMVVLPLAHPALGEVNVTDVWRVSPDDAPGLDVPAVTKLAGTRLGHFAGFLRRDWRVDDLLWGRLDGAEAILAAVLPGEADRAERERLRVRLHAAIVRESLDPREDGAGARLAAALAPAPPGASAEARLEADRALLDAFAADRRAHPPSPLGAGGWLRLVARAAPRAVVVLARGLRPGSGAPLARRPGRPGRDG